jgi:hypothetical protein
MTHLIEHNCQTGEVIEREMNAEELAQFELDKVQEQKSKEQIAEAAAKKAEQKGM